MSWQTDSVDVCCDVNDRAGSPGEEAGLGGTVHLQPTEPQVTVIPGADSLIGDLLDIGIGTPGMGLQQQYNPPTAAQGGSGPGGMDLLGEGLDSLVGLLSLDWLYVSLLFLSFSIFYFS